MNTSRLAAVIVLAAGEGTRMKSATPKVLHRIAGRTLLGHAIAAAREVAPEHLAVVVRHERDLVAAHVAEVDPGVVIVDQDEIEGTGRAAECALEILPKNLEGTILVTYGDVPLLAGETLHQPGGPPRCQRQRRHGHHRAPGQPHRLRPHRARC